MIVGCIGIVFVLFADTTTKKDENVEVKNVDSQNSLEYVEYMEGKVHNIISSIKNVDEAEVMITLESSGEYVYAQEETKNSDTATTNNSEGDNKVQQRDTYEETIILVDSGGSRNALIKTQLEPKVKGVVIVCKGGDDPVVRQNITDTITTALDISSARVSVTEKA